MKVVLDLALGRRITRCGELHTPLTYIVMYFLPNLTIFRHSDVCKQLLIKVYAVSEVLHGALGLHLYVVYFRKPELRLGALCHFGNRGIRDVFLICYHGLRIASRTADSMRPLQLRVA